MKTGFALTKVYIDGRAKTLWERPFPGDTHWLREGTESLMPAEYPLDNEDNDHNRTWLQCRGLIQDYTAGTVKT